MIGEPMYTVSKESNGTVHPNYKWSMPHCQSLHRGTNEELFEKHSFAVIKIIIMKTTNDFPKLTLFAVSKDKWDSEEDCGKLMKNTLCIIHTAVYVKMHWSTMNTEQIQACSLIAVIKLHLAVQNE